MKLIAALSYLAALVFLGYGVVQLVDSTGKWVSADYTLIAVSLAILGGAIKASTERK